MPSTPSALPPAAAPLASVWQPRGLLQWLLMNAAAAVAYGLAAKLGQWAAIGPADVSVLWPPNGVALALVMVWGPRLLPGLVLGSLLPSALPSLSEALPGLNSLGLALLIRLGSAGQWWAMVLLLGDWTTRLQRDGSRFALRFALAALAACTLAPTVGLAALLSVGQVTQQELMQGWLTWWVGDCAGMLVLTPIVLTLLHPAMRRHLLLNQTFPTLALGLGLSLAGTALLGHLQRRADQERARVESSAFAQSMGNLMGLAEADLARLAALHYRIQLEAPAFEREAQAIRAQHDWLGGFAYLRQLNHAQRADFEASIEQDLRAVYPDGSLGRAPPQSSYWAVARLSPSGGQETRLGVDEGSEPRRRLAIEGALNSERATLTAVLDNPLFAEGDEWGVLLYMPVFEGARERHRGARPTGMVSATINLSALVQAALKSSSTLSFPTLLLSSGPQGRGLLIQGEQVLELDASRARDWLQPVPERDRLQQSLRFGDADWKVYSRFADSAALPWPSRLQWALLGFGLLSTALLTGLLTARSRRDQLRERWQTELRNEVALRTEDLSRLNLQLREQALEREQAGQQLAASAKALSQREALLSALLEHIPDPVWLKDLQGRFLVVNAALERLLGRPAQQLIGQRADDFVAPEVAAQMQERDRRALAQRSAVFDEMTLQDAEGREVLQAQIRVAVRDQRGHLTSLLGLGWDITEQRRKELALQRFRWLADSAAQGFALATLDGQVVYLNACAQRWLGDEGWKEEQSRRHARRFYGREAWQRLRDEVLPRVMAQGSWSGMLAPRDLHRREHAELLSSFFLMRDEQGRPCYVALLLTDLSDRLLLEAELAQARDKAEEANRAKTAFLSNISHEIRTPLNAVLGYAQLLHEDERLGAQARAQVESIYQAGTRLLRLINDVLDLSKIEAGALQLSPEALDLCAELQELHSLMQARAVQQQIALRLELGFEGPLMVSLDRGKFGQVVLNLLGNALKFSPEGSQVTLQARLESLAAGPALLLTVQDQGPGISAAELGQLFQPFRQGESGARRGGTGLGLVLSRRLMQAMGGMLWLESSPGQGTRAQLRLPLQTLDGQLPSAGDDALEAGHWRLKPGSRCRVLVAEDDADSRALLVAMLERLGCEVLAGEDGQQALARLGDGELDIVLTDMRMPVMDGVALRQALRLLPRVASVPVVAVTASSLMLSREDFLRLGFADYIAKPFAFAQILAALQLHGGAQLQRVAAAVAPTAALPGLPSSDEIGDLQQALVWAGEGRVMELRQWLAAQSQIPENLRERLGVALARYDLQTAEQLLRDLSPSA
jgi:PAS domain S-box-containing protein